MKISKVRTGTLVTCTIILFMTSWNVIAETAVCTGQVTRLAYHAPGGLYIAIGDSNIFKICDPEVAFNRTTPENCKMISSFLTTARATGKSIKVYVDNAPTTSCSDITAWFSADIRYVELLQ